MTDTEKFMWQLLRRKQLGGFRFRRQHPFGRFVIDYYCSEVRLAVELDGGQHHEMQLADLERTSFLEKRGISVVRVWNNEVFNNTEGVLQMIYNALLERAASGKRSGHGDHIPSP